MILTSDKVLHPDGILRPGRVTVEGGLVTEVEPLSASAARSAGSHTAYLTPGMVDMHCHGGGGAAFATTDPEEVRRAARTHHRTGTATVTASLLTAPMPTLLEQVRTLVPLVDEGVVAGIHLEGPWLSPDHHGAHDPSLLRGPEVTDVRALLEAGQGRISMVTLAPELPGAEAVVRLLVAAGVRVAVGHTDCDGEGLQRAVDWGARVVTHLCSAMRPIHHRDPGPVPVALADDRLTVELIVDGIHLHPQVVGMLTRAARSRIALVTDAMAAAGSGDGRYRLGALPVDVVDGVARLEGGGLAGSTLTLDRAVRTAVGYGMSPASALVAATATPARTLGLAAGVLRAGASADLVAWDESLHPVRVWRAGHELV